MSEEPIPTIGKMLLAGAVALGILALLFFAVRAYGRDLDGRYANSPNREWFKSQRNSAGQWCCDPMSGRTTYCFITGTLS